MTDSVDSRTEAMDNIKDKIRKTLVKIGVHDDIAEITITEPPELKGEHFATETVYGHVKFTDRSIPPKNLFIKKFPSSVLHTEMVKEMKVMDKEAAFFNEFLPFARKFCEKISGSKDVLNFFPKVLYGDDECIIMENLVLDSGYVMLDKEIGQDFHSAKMVVKNLATFHAVSYALIEDMGRDEFLQKFQLNARESHNLSDDSPMAQYFTTITATSLKILSDNHFDRTEEAVELLKGMIGREFKILQTLLAEDYSKPLLVLNHGDTWNNNMLFKKDPVTGEVVENILVDLQITRYASPCLDLAYYFMTSVQAAVRKTHLEDMLRIYYDQFNLTAKGFGTKCPITFEEFFDEYKRCSEYGYLMGLNMASALAVLKDLDMDDMGADKDKMMEKFNSFISNWMDNNPNQTETISRRIVDLVFEFHDLHKNNK